MKSIKRKWDLLSDQRKDALIHEIITYFRDERDQEIGILAAEEVLDFFLDTLGPDIYTRALSDARSAVARGFENIEVDLDLLLGK